MTDSSEPDWNRQINLSVMEICNIFESHGGIIEDEEQSSQDPLILEARLNARNGHESLTYEKLIKL